MPPPGAANETLALRNVHNGHAWSALQEDGQHVFSTRLFLALSGVPDLGEYDSDEDSDGRPVMDRRVGESAVTKLTQEEEACYRPWYDKLVDLQKVKVSFALKDQGESLPKFQRRSQRCIRKITHQVETSMNTYVLLHITDHLLFVLGPLSSSLQMLLLSSTSNIISLPPALSPSQRCRMTTGGLRNILL